MKDVAQRGVIRAVINPSHADSSYQCANKAIQISCFLASFLHWKLQCWVVKQCRHFAKFMIPWKFNFSFWNCENWTWRKICLKSEKYDRPDESSPWKDCLRWYWMTFGQPEQKGNLRVKISQSISRIDLGAKISENNVPSRKCLWRFYFSHCPVCILRDQILFRELLLFFSF